MRDFVKAAVRLVLGLAVLVGVPAALCIAVGWPLPRSVPSWAEIRDGFDRQGVPIDTAISVLAVIVWCAWAQLAIAVLIELAATVRGRTSRRVALLPGTQMLARQFIASAALVLSMLGPGRSGGAFACQCLTACCHRGHAHPGEAHPAGQRGCGGSHADGSGRPG